MLIKLIIPVILSSLLFAACCNCGRANNKASTLPEELQKKADLFVISKTGEDFFTRYISLDNDKTIQTKDGYLVVYKFSVPDKKDIRGEIRFTIDETGNVLTDREIVGIPDCAVNPDNCSFTKERGDVISAAYAVNFKEGIKEWDINFVWSSDYKKYVWEVRSTLEETKSGDRYKGYGLILLIDPNSGKVIHTREWRVN